MNAMLGKLLGSRYKVVQVLGSGGFGHTYIAEDTQRPGNPTCVLKHLSFHSHDPAVLQQVRRLFYTEAETLERLGQHHHQIPQLLAYFEEAEEFYLVQEFIVGNSLNVELPLGTKWSEAQAIALLEDVLAVLDYIHAQGVIHRDLKPENLIRRQQDGKLVLIDFGAVKTITTQIAAVAGQTYLSMPIYTSGYAPSEQCLGQPRFNSDLYALGMITIQTLTGLRPIQLPLDPSTSEVVWRDQARVSDQLAQILNKMVRYHFAERYQSAADVLRDLSQFTDSPLPPATPTAPKFFKRQRLRLAIAGVGVALATTAIALAWRYPLLSKSPVPTPMVAQPTAIAASTAQHISWGERILTPGSVNALKQKGVAALATKAYQPAIAALSAAHQSDRSDPETLIYLNNAQIGNAPAHAIAVVVPLSASLNSAVEILRGVAQAQAQINQAGGIDGVPLKVAIADDQDRPETAQAIAQTWVNQLDILGVIGHGTSDTTLAAGQIYQSGRLVMVSPTSSAVSVSNLGDHIFRTIPSDRFMARALCTYMLTQLRKQRAVVFYDANNSYSRSLRDEFQNALFYSGQGKIVAEFDLANPNFNAYENLEQAIQKKADVIMLASQGSASDRALQVVQINQRRLPILAGDSIYTRKTLQIGGAAATSMVLAVPSNILGNSQLPFQKQAVNLWGSEVNWRTALAYDATQALIAAIRQDASRAGIQKALSTPSFSAQGATSSINFSPVGDREQLVQLVTIIPDEPQKNIYKFKPLN